MYTYMYEHLQVIRLISRLQDFAEMIQISEGSKQTLISYLSQGI